jgi:hypothetical protein
MRLLATSFVCCFLIFCSGMASQDLGEQPVNPDGSTGAWYSVCKFERCEGILYDGGGGHPVGCLKVWVWDFFPWGHYECHTTCTDCRHGLEIFHCRATQTNPLVPPCVGIGSPNCGQEFLPPCIPFGDFCDCMKRTDPLYPVASGNPCKFGICS